MHKDDLRRLASQRKRRSAFYAKAAIALLGVAVIGAWGMLVLG